MERVKLNVMLVVHQLLYLPLLIQRLKIKSKFSKMKPRRSKKKKKKRL